MKPWERLRQEAPTLKPWERERQEDVPAPPARPPMPQTGTAEEFGENVLAAGQEIGRFGEAAARTTGHSLLPSLVEQETPEQGALFDRTMFEVSAALLGGTVGRGISNKFADALKYIGRGFKTAPGAERFLAQAKVLERAAPEIVSASAGKPGAMSLVNPAISGAAVGAAVDWSDPTPWELTDKPVAGAAGVGTAALVGKNTVEDLLVSNARWRKVMMSPNKGTAGAALGAVIGYATAKGVLQGADEISEAVDYVATLFEPREEK